MGLVQVGLNVTEAAIKLSDLEALRYRVDDVLAKVESQPTLINSELDAEPVCTGDKPCSHRCKEQGCAARNAQF